MTKINVSPAFVQLMRDKHLDQKTLLLIADDGGGRYSLQGGACTIGSNFTLIELDAPDPDYDVVLENDAGLHLYSSEYDMYFLEDGLTIDYRDYQIRLKDNAHWFDDGVRIAKGTDVLEAFKKGIMIAGATC
jgi:uncharacterized protein YqkB